MKPNQLLLCIGVGDFFFFFGVGKNNTGKPPPIEFTFQRSIAIFLTFSIHYWLMHFYLDFYKFLTVEVLFNLTRRIKTNR